MSWRFAGQACASSSPSRDGSRNSDAGRFFCSGKALLGGWSAGCGLTGAWSVVGGVTAGAGAGGSRGRSVKPACCHATGSDDCCVADVLIGAAASSSAGAARLCGAGASVYAVSSAAGGVERGAAAAAAAYGVTDARGADGWVSSAGGAGAVAGALLGVSMGTAAGSYNLRASWLLQRSLWRRRAAAQGLHSALVLLVATSRLCWCVRPGLRSAALIYEAPTLHTFESGAREGLRVEAGPSWIDVHCRCPALWGTSIRRAREKK